MDIFKTDFQPKKMTPRLHLSQVPNLNLAIVERSRESSAILPQTLRDSINSTRRQESISTRRMKLSTHKEIEISDADDPEVAS